MKNFNSKKTIKNIEKQINKTIENKAIELNSIRRIKGDGSMSILNATEEELLKLLINQKNTDNYNIDVPYSILPVYISNQLKDIFLNLKIAGYLASYSFYMSDTFPVTLTPMALSYFDDKEKFNAQNKVSTGNISFGNINGSNIIIGNSYNSNFSITSSIEKIEKEIEENGKEDKDELKKILMEFKEYIDSINQTKMIVRNSSLFTRLGTHFEKHNWFYQSVIQLLGTVGLSIMSKG